MDGTNGRCISTLCHSKDGDRLNHRYNVITGQPLSTSSGDPQGRQLRRRRRPHPIHLQRRSRRRSGETSELSQDRRGAQDQGAGGSGKHHQQRGGPWADGLHCNISTVRTCLSRESSSCLAFAGRLLARACSAVPTALAVVRLPPTYHDPAHQSPSPADLLFPTLGRLPAQAQQLLQPGPVPFGRQLFLFFVVVPTALIRSLLFQAAQNHAQEAPGGREQQQLLEAALDGLQPLLRLDFLADCVSLLTSALTLHGRWISRDVRRYRQVRKSQIGHLTSGINM